MNDKLTCDDVLRCEHLASKVPEFLLGRMAKRNSNLILKFESQIKPRIGNLDDNHKHLLNVVLNSDVSELQSVIMRLLKRQAQNSSRYWQIQNAGFIEANLIK